MKTIIKLIFFAWLAAGVSLTIHRELCEHTTA